MIKKNVLITGAVGAWTWSMAEVMQQYECKVTIAAREDLHTTQTKSIRFSEIDEEMKKLPVIYQSGGFDSLIFIFACESEAGPYPYNPRSLYGRRFDELRRHLDMLRIYHGIQNIYLVTDRRVFGSDDTVSEDELPHPDTDEGRSIRMAEEEFLSYSREMEDRSWMIVRTTHVFDQDNLKEFVEGIASADNPSRVNLYGTVGVTSKFIAAADLGEFFAAALPMDVRGIVHVSGIEPLSYGQLSELLRDFGITTTVFEVPGISEPKEFDGTVAFNVFRWTAGIKLSEVLKAAEGELEARKEKEKWSFRRFIKKLGVLVPAVETVLGALLMQLLIAGSRGSTLLQKVDYRLFFCVIIGSAHGSTWGWIAGIIACISYSYAQLQVGTVWDILMNMDNWLPYVLYLAAGGITGYLKTLSDYRIRELEKTVAVREDELEYLKNLHQQTCDMRDSLQEQIINSRDSYGKIYGMVSKLDSLYPDEILLRSVQIYEEVLDNHSIVIYQRINGGNYLRKLVESKDSGSKSNSVDLDSYPMLQPYIDERKLFTNKNFIDGYPAYCITMNMTDSIDIVFAILNAKPRQYTRYYQNLIEIVAQLTRLSMSKAISFLSLPERYVEGTIFLKQDEFIKSWKIRRQIKLENAGEYVALKFSNALPDDILSERLKGRIRTIDIVGKMNDGTRFAILLQANESNTGVIIGRMENRGIAAVIAQDSEIMLYAK